MMIPAFGMIIPFLAYGYGYIQHWYSNTVHGYDHTRPWYNHTIHGHATFGPTPRKMLSH